MAKVKNADVAELPELLTVPEYAAKRKCSVSTVRAMILRGQLEVVKLNRLVRIPASELLREIQQGTRPRREAASM